MTTIPKKILSAFFTFILAGISAFSYASATTGDIRTWDHGTYYRIVFALGSADKATVNKGEKSADITVKFEKSIFKKNLDETFSKKYIKKASLIQETPFTIKLTLQNPDYKTSTMKLKNPERFVLDIKKYLPNVIKNKTPTAKKKIQQPIKKEPVKQEKTATIKEEHSIAPADNHGKNDVKSVFSDEAKILDEITPQNAPEEFLTAIIDMKNEKFEDAYKLFSKIDKTRGNCSDAAQVLSAEALIKMDSGDKKGNIARAIEILNDISGREVDKLLMEKIYYLLGISYSKMKFYEESNGYFKILQKDYPQSYYAKLGKLERAKLMSLNDKLIESDNFLNDIIGDNFGNSTRKDILLLYFDNLYKRKEYTKACEKFEKAVGISKDSEISEIPMTQWNLYAESLYQIKRYKEAKGIFIEISSDKELDAEMKARANLRLGDIAFDEGEENEAFNIWSTIPLDYEKTVAAGESILRMTSARIKQTEDYDTAMESYSELMSSDFPPIIKNEAISETVKILSKKHLYNKALIFLGSINMADNEAIREIALSSAKQILNDGLAFFRTKNNKDEALELFLRYNAFSGFNVKDCHKENILFLTETLIDSAYFEKARGILQETYIGTFNQNLAYDCQVLIAESYIKEQNYEKAVSKLKKIMASSIKKDNYKILTLKLATALYLQKRYDESLNQFLKLKNKSAKSEFLTGKNYFFIGDYKNALNHFEESANLSKNKKTEFDTYCNSLFWQSYSQFKIGKTAEALTLLESIDSKWTEENREDVSLLKANIFNKEGNRKAALLLLENKSDKSASTALLLDNLKDEIDFNSKHNISLNSLIGKGTN